MSLRSVLRRLRAPHRHEIDALKRSIAEIDKRLAAMDVGIHEQLDGLRDDIRLQTERVRMENDALVDELGSVTSTLAARAEELSEAVRVHAQRHAEEVGALAVERSAARIGRLERAIRNLEAQPAGTTAAVASTRPSPSTGVADAAVPIVFDPVSYGAFEEEMRGPSSVVSRLQREYIPDIRALPYPELPVLDVGCGRGEFLALLRDAGVVPRGLDLNADFVEECRAGGYDAVLGDAAEYLTTLPEASLRAVTAFHVVEHLPMPALIRFVAAAYRAIAPGGGLILETPDPANLAVGAHRFWFDPTHLRPLPSALLSFIVRDAGFGNVEIRRLHPLPPVVSTTSTDPVVAELAGVVNEALSGPVDYLLLARRD